jgi:hypothetical protein
MIPLTLHAKDSNIQDLNDLLSWAGAVKSLNAFDMLGVS